MALDHLRQKNNGISHRQTLKLSKLSIYQKQHQTILSYL